jgi:hypothetical protein
MQDNTVGIIDSNSLKELKKRQYNKLRLLGAVQVKKQLLEHEPIYLWFDSGEIFLIDKDCFEEYS